MCHLLTSVANRDARGLKVVVVECTQLHFDIFYPRLLKNKWKDFSEKLLVCVQKFLVFSSFFVHFHAAGLRYTSKEADTFPLNPALLNTTESGRSFRYSTYIF